MSLLSRPYYERRITFTIPWYRLETMRGWARRLDLRTIVFHYFVNGESICANHWKDPQPSVLQTVTGVKCPRCVKVLEDWKWPEP